MRIQKLLNMKKLILLLIPIIFLECHSEKEQNNLDNSTWKFCDGSGHISDVLIFNKEYLYTKNDSNFRYKIDTLVGTVDTITFHYGGRRLFIKDLKGNIGRYCEQ